MPRYKIYRIKDSQKEHFRWSAHTGGLAIVKARDYEAGGEAESFSPYSLWKELQESELPQSEGPLSPGDILETMEGEGPGRLFITKYIGFEPAEWFVPLQANSGATLQATPEASAPQGERALQS